MNLGCRTGEFGLAMNSGSGNGMGAGLLSVGGIVLRLLQAVNARRVSNRPKIFMGSHESVEG